MSVAVAITWDAESGFTETQYRDMAARLGATDAPPPGCEHHAAGYDPDNGFILLEVWESAEAFGQFTQARLAPISRELGISPPSKVAVMPLVRVLTHTT